MLLYDVWDVFGLKAMGKPFASLGVETKLLSVFIVDHLSLTVSSSHARKIMFPNTTAHRLVDDAFSDFSFQFHFHTDDL